MIEAREIGIAAISLAAVLLATGLLSFVWMRYQRQQSLMALRWFYRQHSNDLSEQAETVREQLFQKAFALRRVLELGALTAPAQSPDESAQQFNQCLTLTEALSNDLAAVSDQLSSPFLADSLPLALQALAERWLQTASTREGSFERPSPELSLSLPNEWNQQPAEKHRLLLWCVNECWQVWQRQAASTAETAQSIAQPVQLDLSLQTSTPKSALKSAQEAHAKLQLSFQGPTLQTMDGSSGQARLYCRELDYIAQVFRLLMPGQCQLSCTRTQLIGEFSWADEPWPEQQALQKSLKRSH